PANWRWRKGSGNRPGSGEVSAVVSGGTIRKTRATRIPYRPGSHLGAAVRNVDDVHRPVALAGNKQLVAAKRHVHRLAADLDGGLLGRTCISAASLLAALTAKEMAIPPRKCYDI